MIALLVFAGLIAAGLACLVVLELLTEPPATEQHFTPLAELYQPRHAAPTPFSAWRDR